jgi:hypothetical protein
MEFLQEFIGIRGIELSPIPSARLACALQRSWMLQKSTCMLQKLMQDLVDAKHLDLGEVGVVVCCPPGNRCAVLSICHAAQTFIKQGARDGTTVIAQ